MTLTMLVSSTDQRPSVSGSPSSSWSSNSVPESGRCYTAVVNVTIDIKNDVRAPQFYESVTLRVQRQPLRHVLLIAAGMDPKFRFDCRLVLPFIHSVIQ